MADDATAELVEDLAAEQDALVAVLDPARAGRLVPADAGLELGRARHGRAPRGHRRARGRHLHRRPPRAGGSFGSLRVLGGPDAARRASRPSTQRCGGPRVVEARAARGTRGAAGARPADAGAVGAGHAPAVVRHRPAHGDVGALARRPRRARPGAGGHGPAAPRRVDRRPGAALRVPRSPASPRPTVRSGSSSRFRPVPPGRSVRSMRPTASPDPASEFCRVFVQRIRVEDAPDVVAEGDGAELALRVARSFL